MRFANKASRWTGRPAAFVSAILLILGWAILGPVFHFSDTWQLVINTGTTIITFLMVFLIQNTQNRDSEALHLKIDELIRSHEGAHNALLNLEKLNEEELDAIRDRYAELADNARKSLKSGGGDVDSPEIDLEKAPKG